MHYLLRMAAATLLLAASIGAVGAAQAAPAQQASATCDGRDGVYLYDEIGYGGDCLRLTDDVADLSDYSFNNTTSSLRVVGDWTVTLYVDQDYGGDSSVFTRDDSDLSNNTIDVNRASSARVQRGAVPEEHRCNGDAGVYVYEDTAFEGRCIRFTADVADLSDFGFNNIASSVAFVGEWTATFFVSQNFQDSATSLTTADSDLSNDAVGNDDASSIRVTRGTQLPPGSACDGAPGVYVYEHPSYQGRCLRFTSSLPDLRTVGFNDTISSVQVIGGWIATLYADLSYTGVATSYAQGTVYTGNEPIGDNQATSIEVRTSVPPPSNNACDGTPGVYVYEHPSYQGRCLRFTSSLPDLRTVSFDDTISSVQVIGGWVATLYADLSYTGVATSYAQGSAYTGNEPIGDNQATSVQVVMR